MATEHLDPSLTLETLLNAAVDGIIVIDHQGTIEVFNKAAQLIFGYGEDEVVGCNVSMLMPSPDRENHDNYLKQFLTTRQAKIIDIGRDVVGRRKNGEPFPMNLAVGETRYGEQSKFVGLVRDITRTKLVADQLALVNDELQLIFNEAPTGIVVASEDGEIVNANAWVTDFIKYSARELNEYHLLDLVRADKRDELSATIEELKTKNRAAKNLDTEFIDKNGEILQVKIHLALAGPSADNQRIIALITDRTDEIAKSLISERARERLAHSDRLSSLGEMASAIAHEINQPLTAINSYSMAHKRVLGNASGENAVELCEETKDVLQKIADQAQRGAEIVKRIRGFATKSESSRQPTDLNQCILSALELTRFNADAADVRIETDLFPGMRPAVIDELQIQQVCINIVRNAIDAMASNQGTLRIISTEIENNIVVKFYDNGPGVDAKMAARLFEPFQSIKQGGLGLGLSISHKIIADHKGELSYAPNQPHGSVFTLKIPFQDNT